MPQLCLLVSADHGLLRVVLPTRRKLTIGRSPACDVVLDDDSVSREHARLHVGARIVLEDLRSSNGTSILGRRLERGDKAPLTLGTVFDLAGTTLLLQERRKLPGAARARGRPRRGGPIVADPLMVRIYALLDVLGPSDLEVLLVGDTGTGKRMYAEALTLRSARAKRAFVAVDSGTLDAQSFAAALEEAEDGTILLERVDELPPALHAKVLGPRKRSRARRIFTAHGGGAKLAKTIGGFALAIPPLRARRDDIVPLARLFAEASAKQLGEPVPELSEQAANALTRHEWPRNVRELQGVMDRAVLDANGAAWIDLEHLRLPRYE